MLFIMEVTYRYLELLTYFKPTSLKESYVFADLDRIVRKGYCDPGTRMEYG